jgi:hypothetical protein
VKKETLSFRVMKDCRNCFTRQININWLHWTLTVVGTIYRLRRTGLMGKHESIICVQMWLITH